MLKISDLTASYGQVRAIEDVSFDVRPGEVLALLGHNGAGKTTTVHAITGLMKSVTGVIELDGVRLDGVKPFERARRGIGTVLDGKRVFHSQTVAQNLRIPVTTAQSTFSLAELFPVLADFQQRRAGALSGGQQQMLLIAQALQMNPRYLVLDEPSAGLAPVLVRQLFGVLRKLADRGVGIILVEQLIGPTLKIADRAMVLHLGRLNGEWQVTPSARGEIEDRLRLNAAVDRPTPEV